MMTQDKFDVAFLGLCVTFRQKDNIKELAKDCFDTLNDARLSDEDFERACSIIKTTRKYPSLPLPAEIIEVANENRPRKNPPLSRFDDDNRPIEEIYKEFPPDVKAIFDNLTNKKKMKG